MSDNREKQTFTLAKFLLKANMLRKPLLGVKDVARVSVCTSSDRTLFMLLGNGNWTCLDNIYLKATTFIYMYVV